MMLQADGPDDYVVATGEPHSIRDFLDAAFGHVGLSWTEWVDIDPSLLRPIDVGLLVGNPSRARERLGWAPAVTFGELARMMVDAQVARLRSAG